MSANHYQTLGVETGATPEEIKRAYRRKARTAHPDRSGGNGERMAEVNRAYACLSDPERRAAYDRTGTEDRVETVEERAKRAMLQLFKALLDADINVNLLMAARGAIRDTLLREREAQRENKRKIKSIERKRNKIRRRTKGEQDLFEMVVDSMIADLNRLADSIADSIAVSREMMVIIDDYESGDEPETMHNVIKQFIGA